MIPAPADCLRLMDHYRMLENIRAHSLLVARVADCLAGEVGIEAPLAVAGALMHDIAKTICLNTDQDHARMGRDICLAHGFDELAPLVAQHVRLDEASYPQTPLSAKEIVYYADKRVNHDRIVPLATRLDYILERYGKSDPARHQAIRRNFARCQALEAEIFRGLDFGPEEVAARVAKRLPAWLPDEPMDMAVGSVSARCGP